MEAPPNWNADERKFLADVKELVPPGFDMTSVEQKNNLRAQVRRLFYARVKSITGTMHKDVFLEALIAVGLVKVMTAEDWRNSKSHQDASGNR